MGFGLHSIGGAIGRAADYLTPGTGSNRLTDWGGWGDKQTSNPISAPKTPTAPSYQPDNTSKTLADANSKYDALSKQVSALLSQLNQQPRLPSWDYASNYARAQQQATAAVNPVYQDKLTQYLQKAQAALGQKQVSVTRNKEDIATQLAQALQDSATGRVRTTEDATTQTGDVNQSENTFQRQEGRAFDAARTALLGDVSNAGLTESGIGQGQVQNAVTDRNIASEDQTAQFNAKRRDINTIKTRTLADLDTADTRAQGSAQRSTESQDIDLNNFIQNAQLDEQSFRTQNEADRTLAINSATQSAYQNIVAQAIANLTQGGARAQDIQLFKQVYG